ncbi:hypothetical protein E3N88_27269 [Mikania micrantha]|uniref:Uncharacterized protein n=1 Tax=Mikania micrantha TaxID=192012 RepID=A0A5N6MWC7_9ASTR|nr:hypothetical protein E3N88_27269 [Mikania micrantha]
MIKLSSSAIFASIWVDAALSSANSNSSVQELEGRKVREISLGKDKFAPIFINTLEKEARVALMRQQQQALDEQQKAVDLEFMMKDHSIYQEPMLQLILDRKREIAARWGWHCPF